MAAVARTVTMVVNASPLVLPFALSPLLAEGRHAVTACGSIWFSAVAMVTSTTLFFPLGIRHPVLRYPVLSNSRPSSISLTFSFSVSPRFPVALSVYLFLVRSSFLSSEFTISFPLFLALTHFVQFSSSLSYMAV